jgi:hypothetical protein
MRFARWSSNTSGTLIYNEETNAARQRPESESHEVNDDKADRQKDLIKRRADAVICV